MGADASGGLALIALGIDPGRDGAVAVVTEGAEPRLYPIPFLPGTYDPDPDFLLGLFRDAAAVGGGDCVAALEATFRPNMLVSLTGELRGYLRVAGFRGPRFLAPAPAAWRKAVLGVTRAADLKGAAIDWVRAKYPALELRQTKRSRTDWADGAEAVCLAEYGLLTLKRRCR